MYSLEHVPPRDYYYSTRDWVQSLAIDSYSLNYIFKTFKFAETNFRVTPESLEKEVHSRFEQYRKSQPPEPFVAVIPDGRIWGPYGAVLTPDNKLLWDVSIEFNRMPQDHSVFSQSTMPALTSIGKTVAVLTSAGSYNYYHWLFDVIARIYLIQKSGFKFDQIMVNRTGQFKFQQEILNAFGIPNEKIMDCSNQTHLKADKLIISSLPGYSGHMPKWACMFLREELGGNSNCEQGHTFERIYISRENAKFRKVVNEKEIIPILQDKLGFKVVYLETLSILEQIQIFAGAKHIISPHGAGLANLVFCKPGIQILEFFAPYYVNPCYWVLCNHVNLRYYYLIGKGKRPSALEDSHAFMDNIEVDISDLLRIIKRMGIGPIRK